MTGDEIEKLMQLLQKDNPWSSHGPNAQPTAGLDPCELALRDPGFGWRFAKFHAESRLSLDAAVVPPAIWRAYRHLLQHGGVDVNMALVEALNLPESKAQRDLLRGLLVCKETTLEMIAQLCGMDIEVVKLFEALFWNCWDRRRDRVYIGRICQQIGQAQKHSDEPEDPGLELLRISWQNGSVEDLLAAAKVAAPKEPLSIPELLLRFRKAVLTSAAEGLQTKTASQENPALKLALKMAVANLKANPYQEREEGLSPDEAVQLVVDQIHGKGKEVVSYEI